jgi:hypothetical protein
VTPEQLIKILTYVRLRVALYGIVWLVMDTVIEFGMMPTHHVGVLFYLAAGCYFLWAMVDLLRDAVINTIKK